MVAPTGTTQKFLNPPEDNFGVDQIFNDIYQNPNFVEPFGLGVAPIAREGNIFRQVSSPGISPGATGADNVLAVFSLPANSFDIAGRGVNITAAGKFATTANNKTVRIYYNATTAVVGSTVTGGTLVADTAFRPGATSAGKSTPISSNTVLQDRIRSMGNVTALLLAARTLAAALLRFPYSRRPRKAARF